MSIKIIFGVIMFLSFHVSAKPLYYWTSLYCWHCRLSSADGFLKRWNAHVLNFSIRTKYRQGFRAVFSVVKKNWLVIKPYHNRTGLFLIKSSNSNHSMQLCRSCIVKSGRLFSRKTAVNRAIVTVPPRNFLAVSVFASFRLSSATVLRTKLTNTAKDIPKIMTRSKRI